MRVERRMRLAPPIFSAVDAFFDVDEIENFATVRQRDSHVVLLPSIPHGLRIWQEEHGLDAVGPRSRVNVSPARRLPDGMELAFNYHARPFPERPSNYALPALFRDQTPDNIDAIEFFGPGRRLNCDTKGPLAWRESLYQTLRCW